jgi:hypothetical protein
MDLSEQHRNFEFYYFPFTGLARASRTTSSKVR